MVVRSRYDWQPHGGYFPNGLNWLANATGAVRNNILSVVPFILKLIVLPRQARGKHRGQTPKEMLRMGRPLSSQGMMPYANYLCANSTYSKTGEYKTMNGSHHGMWRITWTCVGFALLALVAPFESVAPFKSLRMGRPPNCGLLAAVGEVSPGLT